MDWTPSITSIVISIIAGLIGGYSIARTRRLARYNDELVDQLEVCGEVLAAIERAHDPGREVQERLAASIEPTLVVRDRELPVSERRALALALASDMVETIRRANLELRAKEDPGD